MVHMNGFQLNVFCLVQMDQAVLGMPSREYYVFDSDSEKYIDSYLRFMIQVAILMGADEKVAHREMKEVFDFEQKIANVCRSLLILIIF